MAAKISKKTYGFVWLALLGLLLATWIVSRIDLKSFNVGIALLISFTKMILIILFFMNARYSPRLIWVVAGAGFLWFFIFLDLTLSDYLTRNPSWSQ
jgi:caa(3)-type oxidase subunit IV